MKLTQKFKNKSHKAFMFMSCHVCQHYNVDGCNNNIHIDKIAQFFFDTLTTNPESDCPFVKDVMYRGK